MSVPNPPHVPAPVPASPLPEIIEKLVKTAPPELQPRLRKALEKACVINPDDPAFGLVLVLELVGNYYQRIAAQVIKAGEDIKGENAKTLQALDERVMAVQSFSQVVRQGIARLENVEGTIVSEFPAGKVAQTVVEKVNATLNTFPLDDLQKKVDAAQSMVEYAGIRVESNSAKLDTAATRIETAATRINAVKLPSLSWACAVISFMLGAVAAVGVLLLFLSWAVPDARKVAGWVDRGETGTVLIIPKKAFDDARTDSNENVVIPLTKKAP